MHLDKYFFNDYQSARQAFLAAVGAAGGRLASFRNRCVPSTDTQLFTDVALLGNEEAGNALVLISGTHGVEGFAGSGIQVGLLLAGVTAQLKENTRIIMIHALNPYGFANLRRFNEDNVDLNRNFVDHFLPYPDNDGYDALADSIAPESWTFFSELFSKMRLYRSHLISGRAKFQEAVTSGQYKHPDGLFYGGHFATWSNRILHEIVERYLLQSERVVVVDLHTGLGPYGHGEVILNVREDDPVYERAVSWWGAERVKSTMSGDSVSAHLSGALNQAFPKMLPNAEVTAVGLEFGTLPATAVFDAMRAENWLHHHAGTAHAATTKIKQRLLRAFCPDDDLWRGKVWEEGRFAIEQVLAKL